MPIAKPTLDSINTLLNEPIQQITAISGGCISNAYRLTTADNKQFFLKTHERAPARLFAAEAASLSAINASNSLPTPRVIGHGESFLLLDYIQAAPAANNYWTQLAEGLATMHQQLQANFGFTLDNFCGATPQPNPSYADGFAFFAEQRLLYQSRLARDKNLLDKNDSKAIERIAQHLPDWLPNEPAVLLHGDLWSGNIHSNEQGQPVLIDPACYWGWREADIAMTLLFGGFDDRFYQHYQQRLPMQDGWQQRVPLYNLYHLLNHLNLFGGSYLSQIREVLNRFS